MASFFDNFERADQSGLGTSAEDWSWVFAAGSSNASINTNRAELRSTGRFRPDTVMDTADQSAVAVIATTPPTWSQFGLMVRCDADAANFYWLYCQNTDTGGRVQLHHFVDGTGTNIKTMPAHTFEAGDKMELRVEGDLLTVLINDSVWDTHTDSTFSGGVYTGLIHNGGANVFVDEWTGSDFVALAGTAHTRTIRSTTVGTLS